MATTTTNFGWDIPQSTDLVKDGATAIAALGQDIDTAFVDFKGGTTGQVLKKTSGTDLDVEWGTPSSGLTLINTTSFSGVATQSIKDVFSATYKHYLIVVSSNSASAAPQLLQMRMRVSGADNSSNNYYYSGIGVGSNSVSPAVSGIGSNGLTNVFDVGVSNDTTRDECTSVIQLLNPFATKRTSFASQVPYSDPTVGFFQRLVSGQMSVTTSYTGFTLIGSNANITGEVSVYGYNK